MENRIRAEAGHPIRGKKKVRFPNLVKQMIGSMHSDNDKKTLGSSLGRAKSLMNVIHTNFRKLFFQHAYIITNISMMIWSIIFHSWLGFVLLIWSNVIWIRANRRHNMMNSSPFLVVFAVSLLLINYVYGMEFTNDELPTSVIGVNLQQIGIIKYTKHAAIPLFIKSLLTASFWMTLRIKFQEKLLMKHKKTLRFEETIRELMGERNGNLALYLLKKFCVFGFMWIIVIALFATAIIGEGEMSLFRIINMCFFLFFVLLFQLHFKAWLRLMGVFWKTLILYSMAALMLTYSYQFDSFPKISWQEEIGLHKYRTRQLALRLFSFTAVIVLIGLQMNEFQEKFMRIFQKSNLTDRDDERGRTDEGAPSVSDLCFITFS